MTQATQQFLRRATPILREAFDFHQAHVRTAETISAVEMSEAMREDDLPEREILRPVNVGTPGIFERPFADITEVRGRINLSGKDIMEEIEHLHLRWAFNFAPQNERVFLRVYKPAVEHWVNPKAPVPRTFDALLRKIFPGANFAAGAMETITGAMFQETFNLTPQNMTQLLAAGKIMARDDRWGNGVTPLILLPSVVRFLKARQLS